MNVLSHDFLSFHLVLYVLADGVRLVIILKRAGSDSKSISLHLFAFKDSRGEADERTA